MSWTRCSSELLAKLISQLCTEDLLHPLTVFWSSVLGGRQPAVHPGGRTPLRLVWLTVRRGLAEFRGTPDLSEHAVVGRELGSAFEEFRSRLVDPDSYVWLPRHPWQLDHVVRTQWARELATG